MLIAALKDAFASLDAFKGKSAFQTISFELDKQPKIKTKKNTQD